MPEPALPEVSGPGARPLARRTTRRTAPGALCSCRLHAASSTGVAGSAEQRGDLRTVVPCQCPDTDRCRVRSPVPRSRDWILQRAPHLEPETAASSSCSLRGGCRRARAGPYALGEPPKPSLLPPPKCSQRGVPRQVHRRTPAGSGFGTAAIPWPPPGLVAAPPVSEPRPSTVRPALGGLCEADFRRTRAGPSLSGRVYPPGSNLESAPRLHGGSTGHIPLARFRTRKQKAAADAADPGVSAPFSAACAATRFHAHPALRLSGRPPPGSTASALEVGSRRCAIPDPCHGRSIAR